MPRRRTGAAAVRSADNYTIYRLVIVLLCLAVAASAAGSVEGLLHAGSWSEIAAPWMQWTLPVGVDVFLVGTALATLALRERRAYVAAIGCAIITVALVTFSATVNYLYVLSNTTEGTPAHAYGPWIKGALPILLLLATEIISAMTSTRNNKANSPLNRARRQNKKLSAELRALKKTLPAASKTPVEPVRAQEPTLFGEPA